MTRRFPRALAVAIALVVPAAAPAAAGPGAGAACAQETSRAGGTPHAALVVSTGSENLTYCVALSSSSVNGIQLIKLAGEQYGLTYGLGYGGQAVCQLAGVGPSGGGNCFQAGDPYWAYWLGDGKGGWTYSSTGATSVSVSNGDIQGWSWGTGTTSTHPRPPDTRAEDVCGKLISPPSTPSPKPPSTPSPKPGGPKDDGGGGGSGDRDPSTPGPGGDGADDGNGGSGGDDHGSGRGPGSGQGDGKEQGNGNGTGSAQPSGDAPAGSPEGTAPGSTELAAGGNGAGSPGSPPTGVLVAAGAIVLLAAAGYAVNRSRRARSPHAEPPTDLGF